MKFESMTEPLKVLSIMDLSNKAHKDEKYSELAVRAAQNLGFQGDDLDGALRWLDNVAAETEEAGTVAEINDVASVMAESTGQYDSTVKDVDSTAKECPNCKGTGVIDKSNDTEPCPNCAGQGTIT